MSRCTALTERVIKICKGASFSIYVYIYIGDSFSHFPNQYRYIYMGKWESGKNPYRTRAYAFPTKWESIEMGKWEIKV